MDLHSDLSDLARLTPAERHLLSRLVAFFATGDTIVSNNLVLNLYQHVNSPEGRLYLSQQLYEEAVHVQFYLTLLDTYVPDEAERSEAFAAVENIPSIKRKADFCFRWINSIYELRRLETREDRRQFLLNLICFAVFAYVYFLRSRGLLNGLASGTNWVFRDESLHMAFAFDVVETVRAEEPDLFDGAIGAQVREMLAEAVECEYQFAEDVHGVAGRAGALELLRTPGVVLPDRSQRDGRFRRGLLRRRPCASVGFGRRQPPAEVQTPHAHDLPR